MSKTAKEIIGAIAVSEFSKF